MAYFSKLGTGNIIVQVTAVADDIAITEQAGMDFLNNLFGSRDVWKQTYIDGSQRKNYAGVGFQYDSARDAFIPPKPYASWTLNESTCQWDSPTPYPDDGEIYKWNESTLSWDLIT